MSENNLIFTFSGIRGIFGRELNIDVARKIGIAFGYWFNNSLLKDEKKQIIIGRDTRPSGEELSQALIEGLVRHEFEIIDVGICPTPVIIHAKNSMKIPAGIIITGSHNPPNWNGLKLIDSRNYLDNIELQKIKALLSNTDSVDSKLRKEKEVSITELDPIPYYLQDLYNLINIKKVKKKNNLRVVIDTGAGAGKVVTPKLLSDLGCTVKNINNELFVNDVFPREIEPISANLHDLIMEVWQGKYDIGFAHDSDADRLAIIGDNGICYPEDIGLAIILENTLQNLEDKAKDVMFVTNLASSLMFEAITDNYGAQVIRTPIGEMFLIDKMLELREKFDHNLIFGGEGSCGGVMYPPFNNTRDGIFAVAKIIEILALKGERVSKLVSKLPKFYSHREIIKIDHRSREEVISKIKEELIEEGENVVQTHQDLRFGKEMEWFVLIHPSNTEPIIRIISEAKSQSLARVFSQTTSELVKLVLSRL
jgi:phosphomannomutase